MVMRCDKKQECRMARIAFADGMYIGIHKDDMVSLLQALPPDTRIVGVYGDHSKNVSYLVISSMEFDPVEQGEMLPEIEVEFKCEPSDDKKKLMSLSWKYKDRSNFVNYLRGVEEVK